MMVKITIGRVVFAFSAVIALGMVVAAAGLIPIAASTGHWKITDWFLHWTMQNSARTYSAVQTPKVIRDDTGLVSAAGHFRQSCQVCHGAPGKRPPRSCRPRHRQRRTLPGRRATTPIANCSGSSATG
ncbi:hypothetical protein ACFSLT_24250 [Novosphingobium resinovorum]